jgi:phage shock protein A
LEIKIKEIADNRNLLNQGINKMESSLRGFREHRFNELSAAANSKETKRKANSD